PPEAEPVERQPELALVVAKLEERVHDLAGEHAERAVFGTRATLKHHQPIETTPQPAQQGTGHAGSDRVHDLVSLLSLDVEAWDQLRRLLEVTVHDHRPRAAAAAEAGRDGRVLAEVAAQPEGAHVRVAGGKLGEHLPAVVGAPVVHEHDFEAVSHARERGAQALVQPPQAGAAAVDGDHDAQRDHDVPDQGRRAITTSDPPAGNETPALIRPSSSRSTAASGAWSQGASSSSPSGS